MFIKASRIPPLLGLIAALVLLSSLPGRASAGLSGNFGCLGNVVYSFVYPANTPPQTLTYTQAMRLAISTSGNGLTANIFYGISGTEICNFPRATGTISVDPTGVGSLTLTFSTNTNDEDNDLACSLLFSGRSSVTENFHIVATSGGSHFFFLGNDDFLTPSIKDNGDFLAVTGNCDKQ